MKMPHKPTGNTAKVNYDREMWDVIRSLTPLPGVGIKFTTTSSGTIYNADKKEGGGSNVKGIKSYLAWFESDNQVRATSITYELIPGGTNAVRGIDNLYLESSQIYISNEFQTVVSTGEVYVSYARTIYQSADETVQFMTYLNEENKSIFISKLALNGTATLPNDTAATGLQYFLPVIVEPNTVKFLDYTMSGLIFTQQSLEAFTFVLPDTPVMGCFYQFALRFNEKVVIQARENQRILNGAETSTVLGAISSETGGSFLDLFYLGSDTVGIGPGSNGLWMVRMATGLWTLT